MTAPTDPLRKLMPGFEFLQDLARSASSAMPQLGPWVTPTLDPAELDKRIEELRAVRYWLEQNAQLLGSTIQALEVQRLTLTTLQTMNVQVDELRAAMTIPPAAPTPAPATPEPATSAPAAGGASPRARAPAQARAATPPPAAVDPMQWWGALTQQFTQIASDAMKDVAQATQAPATAPAPTRASARKAASRQAPAAPEPAAAPAAPAPAARPASRRSRAPAAAPSRSRRTR